MRRNVVLVLLALLGTAAVDAQRLIVTDSGAVEREITRFIVADAGAVEREIQRAFVVDSGGTARLVFSGTTVTLSGEVITHSVPNGSTATVRLTIDADGNVYKIVGSTTTPIDTGTDWIRPTSANDGLYQVRFTQVELEGNNPDSGDSLGIWHALSIDRGVGYTESANDTEDDGEIRVEIRYNGGAVIATADYPLTAQVGLPL